MQNIAVGGGIASFSTMHTGVNNSCQQAPGSAVCCGVAHHSITRAEPACAHVVVVLLQCCARLDPAPPVNTAAKSIEHISGGC